MRAPGITAFLEARDAQRSLKEFAMHDILIALVFVSMVASPALVAAFPQDEDEEGPEARSEGMNASTATHVNQG